MGLVFYIVLQYFLDCFSFFFNIVTEMFVCIHPRFIGEIVLLCFSEKYCPALIMLYSGQVVSVDFNCLNVLYSLYIYFT